MSPAKHPHTITPFHPCFTVGTTHVKNIHLPTLCLTQTWRLEAKISNLDSSDQRTDFHLSNGHCSHFLAQASLLLLLMSFSSVFFAAIWPWSPEQLMLRCVCYLNFEAFIWAAIWGAVNFIELILCSIGNSGSSFHVEVLMRDSFIIERDGFCDCTWSNYKCSWNVP